MSDSFWIRYNCKYMKNYFRWINAYFYYTQSPKWMKLEEMSKSHFMRRMHLDGLGIYFVIWLNMRIYSKVEFNLASSYSFANGLLYIREKKSNPSPDSKAQPTVEKIPHVENYSSLNDSLQKNWSDMKIKTLKRRVSSSTFLIHSRCLIRLFW